MKTVYIQTFGCQMNTADSAEMMLALSARGCISCQDAQKADVMLINTCTIREHAEHKALSLLGRLRKWKEAKAGRIIIFTGCAAQRLGGEVKKKFQYVDIVCGAKSIDAFDKIIEASGLFGDAPVKTGAVAGSSPIALVNIMRGCSCKCSYCIVPYVRGEASSLDFDEVLKNIQAKLAAGAKEIVLLGQTVNAYNYKGKNFAALLKEAVKLNGLDRLRYLSPHPLFITEEVVEVMATEPKMAKHLHLPVQSGSSKVLKEMKRGYSREEFLSKIALLKKGGIWVSTDIIVGYPTETEEDFKETLTLVDECKFSGAYCFKFSPRMGTPAFSLKELPINIVEKRLDILLNKVKLNAKAAYKAQEGTVQRVLMENPHNGRTLSNFWVKTEKPYKTGDTVDLTVKKAEESILLA
ncbi:MAG: tRNA (N6-isopentenyl adenosine(37)-C2)-methylthiotransferase MiaB [Elusimicrobia bacterium]|nr:tRNA (N6-isopentenyl adenosine(37)-C2)-methylthiotransferase MiaB [Elusimicrobiota bacterium]